jgi:hypothetical protein
MALRIFLRIDTTTTQEALSFTNVAGASPFLTVNKGPIGKMPDFPYASRLFWRREWDSNLWYGYPSNGCRERRIGKGDP